MKIVVFPLRENPYQKYLYDHLKAHIDEKNIIYFKDINTSDRLSFLKDVLLWPFKLYGVHDDEKVFHIHWQFFYFLINKKPRLLPSVLLALWTLIWIKLFSYKIVWTVHDYHQHDTDSSLDKIIRKIIILFSNRIITLSNVTRDDLVRWDRVSLDKVSVIPLGNYGSDVRFLKSNSNKVFTFAFFGLVRKYKGVERLIASFKQVKNANIRLKIVGDCYHDKYHKSLLDLAAGDKRISIKNQFLSDTQLDEFIHESNIVVLPFLEVTNSSSALTAYSKGRPVIAPSIGALQEHPRNIGIFYSPNTQEELTKSLQIAIKNQSLLDELGQNALEYSKLFSWTKIATQTFELYENLFQKVT